MKMPTIWVSSIYPYNLYVFKRVDDKDQLKNFELHLWNEKVHEDVYSKSILNILEYAQWLSFGS